MIDSTVEFYFLVLLKIRDIRSTLAIYDYFKHRQKPKYANV